MNDCLKTGARVYLPDYNINAPADLFAVGATRVVRFNGDPKKVGTYGEEAPGTTHRLHLNRSTNYWRPDLGIAVVDARDLEPITQGEGP